VDEIPETEIKNDNAPFGVMTDEPVPIPGAPDARPPN
jgi:hypothetical protein